MSIIDFEVEVIPQPDWVNGLPEEINTALKVLSVESLNKIYQLGVDGKGFHHSQLSSIWAMKGHLKQSEAFEVIRAAGDCYERDVPDSEIETAIESVYKANRYQKKQSPSWSIKNDDLIADIVSSSRISSLTDFTNQFELEETSTASILKSLFAAEDLLCISNTVKTKNPTIDKTSELLEIAEEYQFICPSPMKGLTGVNNHGKPSKRCNNNVSKRMYITIEFDSLPQLKQLAIINHLAKIAPLVLVMESGGKSLHSWFDCRGKSDNELKPFMDYAVSLGADSALWQPCQFVRMPGAIRHQPEKPECHGNTQRVITFRPTSAASEEWNLSKLPDNFGDAKNLRLQHISDIGFSTESRDFIEGLLMRESVSLIVASPGSGKSFLALELASCVATGNSWRDREVEQGAVVYVCLEGVLGFKHRIHGCLKNDQLEDTSPFYLVDHPLNMLREEDGIGLAKEINETIASIDEEVSMVIIDTLSRSISGANENAVEDMTQMLKVVELLKSQTKAHIMMVHHCGKDETRGARGHSSLLGAVDTEITLDCDKQNNIITARVTKQKDLECSGVFPFKLKKFTLGEDDKNRPITSCQLEHLDESEAPTKKGRKAENTPEDLLTLLPCDKVSDWKDLANENLGIPHSRFYSLKRELKQGIDFDKTTEGFINLKPPNVEGIKSIV